MASCYLIGPIEERILQVVQHVRVIAAVEAELQLPNEQVEVAF